MNVRLVLISIVGISVYLEVFPMAKTGIAKLFRNGRSQAVRLPQEFRFEGDRVRIRRIDQGVLLESLITDAAEWFDELDRFNPAPFMAKSRNHTAPPRREIFKATSWSTPMLASHASTGSPSLSAPNFKRPQTQEPRFLF